MSNCVVCGKPNAQVHHLIEGTANRRLSDEDELVIPLCQEHHIGKYSVHMCKPVSVFAHISGQLAYERDKCAEGMTVEEARESFRRRYGRSYL